MVPQLCTKIVSGVWKMLQMTWKLVYMYLGVVEKKLPARFWIFGFFPILEGLKVEKINHFERFWPKMVIFSTFRPSKIGKIQKSKIWLVTFFLLPQGTCIPIFRSIKAFSRPLDTIFVQSWGTIFFFGDGSKNALFRPKKGQFLRFSDQIFRIH